MSYTAPQTWNAETVTAAKWNIEIRDNQRAIKDPPCQNYEANQGADYNTVSTNYVNVDGTNLSFSLTTTGGDVLVCFTGASTSRTLIDVSVDGTRIMNNGSGFIVQGGIPSLNSSFCYLVTGLSAGVHTFVLQYKTASTDSTIYAGAGTAGYDIHPQFWAREIS